MPISDIPILSMLRTRMQWHQERQQVLAENVANSDTPNFRAQDLAPPDFEHEVRTASLALATTNPGHIAAAAGTGSPFAEGNDLHFQLRPRGNAVTHEEEMLKLASNQMDYDAVTSIYTHSLNLIKTAIGRS